jgi:catabolite regulation protein CreA
MLKKRIWAGAAPLGALSVVGPASADSADPDLIRKSTTFKLLTPNDKLAVYGIDDPLVDGVACHYTAPEKGGLMGAFGLAEQTSDLPRVPSIRPDQIQRQIRTGRRRLLRTPLDILQKDANRPRLRRQA